MRSKKFTPAFSLLVGVIIKYILNIKFFKILPDVVWYGGVIECCIAALTCYFVAFAISFGFFWKKIKIKLKIFKFLLKQIIASCIMALTLKYTHLFLGGIIQEKIAIIVSGLVAILIYLISTFLLSSLRNSDVICVYVQNFTKKREKRRILYKNGE